VSAQKETVDGFPESFPISLHLILDMFLSILIINKILKSGEYPDGFKNDGESDDRKQLERESERGS
jgi:hypothetical protein